jgi:hypothetical protein
LRASRRVKGVLEVSTARREEERKKKLRKISPHNPLSFARRGLG